MIGAEEEIELLEILTRFKEGSDVKQAAREIWNMFEGLRLDGELVELSCNWCGNPIQPFVDEVARIDFDPGVPDSRECPGIPAQVFLVCEDCMEKGAGR